MYVIDEKGIVSFRDEEGRRVSLHHHDNPLAAERAVQEFSFPTDEMVGIEVGDQVVIVDNGDGQLKTEIRINNTG